MATNNTLTCSNSLTKMSSNGFNSLKIAKHYTEAANALRNNDEESSERYLQQAQQQQRFNQTGSAKQSPKSN